MLRLSSVFAQYIAACGDASTLGAWIAMLGKSERQHLGEFEPGEVITICDHLRLLICRELKHKTPREACRVALDGLVERPGRHPVEFRQIGDDHYLLAANDQDAVLTGRPRFRCRRSSLFCLGEHPQGRSGAYFSGTGNFAGRSGIAHVVLNARQDSGEAQIVSKAGQAGCITPMTFAGPSWEQPVENMGW